MAVRPVSDDGTRRRLAYGRASAKKQKQRRDRSRDFSQLGNRRSTPIASPASAGSTADSADDASHLATLISHTSLHWDEYDDDDHEETDARIGDLIARRLQTPQRYDDYYPSFSVNKISAPARTRATSSSSFSFSPPPFTSLARQIVTTDNTLAYTQLSTSSNFGSRADHINTIRHHSDLCHRTIIHPHCSEGIPPQHAPARFDDEPCTVATGFLCLPRNMPGAVPPPSAATVSRVRAYMVTARAQALRRIRKRPMKRSSGRSARILRQRQAMGSWVQRLRARCDPLRQVRKAKRVFVEGVEEGEGQGRAVVAPWNPSMNFKQDRLLTLPQCLPTSQRVHDPVEMLTTQNTLNPWTTVETFRFLKCFVWYGKDFGRIAQQMTYKSTADVVNFYYRRKIPLGLKLLGTARKNPTKHADLVSDAYLMHLAKQSTRATAECTTPYHIPRKL